MTNADEFDEVRLYGVVRSNHGLVRPVNEDAVVANRLMTLGDSAFRWERVIRPREAPELVMVLDGMGGHRGGAVASRLAGTLSGLGLGQCDTDEDLRAVLSATSDTVRGAASGVAGLADMGCTIVGLLIGTAGFTVFNLGDSRAYSYVDGALGQLSVDDRRQVGDGAVLTQAIGRPRADLDPHLLHRSHVQEQRLLLCSDGLSDFVDLQTIKSCMGAPSAELAADALMDAALAAGAPDNVSVVVMFIYAWGRSVR